MQKKAFLFIDSSNFYHTLKDSNALNWFNYTNLYKELSKQYLISKVFFYDSVKSIDLEPEQYSKQQTYHQRLVREIPNLTLRLRKLRYLGANKRVEDELTKTSFCDKCKQKVRGFLSRAGLVKLSKEKGIDIMLATDMIRAAFEEQFDIALLATGDADFVPAVKMVQTLKKEVVNIHFYSNSASELRNTCNSHKLIQIDNQNKVTLK